MMLIMNVCCFVSELSSFILMLYFMVGKKSVSVHNQHVCVLFSLTSVIHASFIVTQSKVWLVFIF